MEHLQWRVKQCCVEPLVEDSHYPSCMQSGGQRTDPGGMGGNSSSNNSQPLLDSS